MRDMRDMIQREGIDSNMQIHTSKDIQWQSLSFLLR